jgi:hypothetical protein
MSQNLLSIALMLDASLQEIWSLAFVIDAFWRHLSAELMALAIR